MTGRYARQQIELRTNAFWRHHWRWAVPGTVAACLGAGAVGLLIPVSFPMWIVYPLLVLAVLSTMRPYFYGTYHLEMAAEAEAWTSKELKKLCGPGWHVVDGISFAFHDVDHVLVGPGGVYAIETKYTDASIDVGSRRGRQIAERWTDQALEAARAVRYLLWHQERPEVQPIVVAWGGDVTGTPWSAGAAPVLHRRDLRDFLARRNEESGLSRRDIDALVQRLIGYRLARIDHERSTASRRAA